MRMNSGFCSNIQISMYLGKKKIFNFFSEKKKVFLFCFSIVALTVSTVRDRTDSLHESMCHSLNSLASNKSGEISQNNLPTPNNDESSPSGECTECTVSHFHRHCNCNSVTLDSRLRIQNYVSSGPECIVAQSLNISDHRSQLFRPPIS